MKLYILRHGEAEPFASHDSLRPLTARGQSDVERAVRSKFQELSQVERVLVSPYLRAQQTADIVKAVFPNHVFDECNLLVPDASPIVLLDYLNSLFEKEDLESLLLVSHQPLVGTLIDGLSGADPGRYFMGTAALAALDCEIVAAGCADVQWLINPND